MSSARVSSFVLVALAGALLAPAAAFAQEAIATGRDESPPAAEAPKPYPSAAENSQSDEAIGRWARGVLAGAPAEGAKPKGRCTPADDRKPHGEVWAGAGTGGYRELGGVVTKPIGDCGSVTIAIDKMQDSGYRRRR